MYPPTSRAAINGCVRWLCWHSSESATRSDQNRPFCSKALHDASSDSTLSLLFFAALRERQHLPLFPFPPFWFGVLLFPAWQNSVLHHKGDKKKRPLICMQLRFFFFDQLTTLVRLTSVYKQAFTWLVANYGCSFNFALSALAVAAFSSIFDSHLTAKI